MTKPDRGPKPLKKPLVYEPLMTSVGPCPPPHENIYGYAYLCGYVLHVEVGRKRKVQKQKTYYGYVCQVTRKLSRLTRYRFKLRPLVYGYTGYTHYITYIRSYTYVYVYTYVATYYYVL